MKTKLIFLSFIVLFAEMNMQGQTAPEQKYRQLQEQFCKGWNTWNPRSTLSFVQMPSGFSINIGFKDYLNAEVLTETILGYDHEDIFPGAHTYNGSYTCQELRWSDMKFRIESAHAGDDLVVLITPLEVDKVKAPDYYHALQGSEHDTTTVYFDRIKSPLIIVETGMLWNRKGYLSKKKNSLLAETPTDTIEVFVTGKPVEEYYVGSVKTPYLCLKINKKQGISTGKIRTLDKIESIIQEQKAKWEQDKEKYNKLADVYDAMQTCIAWNTVYEPQFDRVISPVSRRWSYNNKGYVMYCWDTYFGAYQAAASGNKAIAYFNAVEMTKEKTDDGFVPNVRQANGYVSLDRSQPPVGSYCVREIYRQFGDKWFLELVYDDLLDWNRWWAENRDYKGLLCYGSNYYEPVIGFFWEYTNIEQVHGWFGASMESGWDGSMIYENQEFDKERSIMKLWDASLNGLYVMDCKALADIAEALGKTNDAKELLERAGKYAKNIHQLWDKEAGFFKNKNWETNKFPDFTAINGFLALLSGTLSDKQLESVISDYLLNPDEFYTNWIVPVVPKSNPAYGKGRYWDGRVWPPVNFLIFTGLSQYDSPLAQKAKKILTQKSRELLKGDWQKYHFVRENYDAETGTGTEKELSASFYHWGGLLGLMSLIEEGMVQSD
jgi:putative isomerase